MSIEKLMFNRLKYTPDDGKVWWVKHPRWPSYSGKEAGNMMQNGYRKLKFCNKQYLVHRVAWLLHHGSWPIGDIDHIQNRKSATVKNKTGFLGVVKRRNKYAAHIHKNGKQIYLGLFETAELAHKAYKENT